MFVLFVVNARNVLPMLSDSESELFITQSSFSGSTSIELSETNFVSLFTVQTTRKQLTISVYAPRIFLRTFFHLKPGFHIVVSVVSVDRKKFIGQIEFILSRTTS